MEFYNIKIEKDGFHFEPIDNSKQNASNPENGVLLSKNLFFDVVTLTDYEGNKVKFDKTNLINFYNNQKDPHENIDPKKPISTNKIKQLFLELVEKKRYVEIDFKDGNLKITNLEKPPEKGLKEAEYGYFGYGIVSLCDQDGKLRYFEKNKLIEYYNNKCSDSEKIKTGYLRFTRAKKIRELFNELASKEKSTKVTETKPESQKPDISPVVSRSPPSSGEVTRTTVVGTKLLSSEEATQDNISIPTLESTSEIILSGQATEREISSMIPEAPPVPNLPSAKSEEPKVKIEAEDSKVGVAASLRTLPIKSQVKREILKAEGPKPGGIVNRYEGDENRYRNICYGNSLIQALRQSPKFREVLDKAPIPKKNIIIFPSILKSVRKAIPENLHKLLILKNGKGEDILDIDAYVRLPEEIRWQILKDPDNLNDKDGQRFKRILKLHFIDNIREIFQTIDENKTVDENKIDMFRTLSRDLGWARDSEVNEQHDSPQFLNFIFNKIFKLKDSSFNAVYSNKDLINFRSLSKPLPSESYVPIDVPIQHTSTNALFNNFEYLDNFEPTGELFRGIVEHHKIVDTPEELRVVGLKLQMLREAMKTCRVDLNNPTFKLLSTIENLEKITNDQWEAIKSKALFNYRESELTDLAAGFLNTPVLTPYRMKEFTRRMHDCPELKNAKISKCMSFILHNQKAIGKHVAIGSQLNDFLPFIDQPFYIENIKRAIEENDANSLTSACDALINKIISFGYRIEDCKSLLEIKKLTPQQIQDLSNIAKNFKELENEIAEVNSKYKPLEIDVTRSYTVPANIPHILPIAMNRFLKDGTNRDTPIIPSKIVTIPKEGGGDAIYELLSVIVLKGDSPMNGHYITYVPQEDGTWVEYNDEAVNVLNEDDCIKNITTKSYVYLYELVKDEPEAVKNEEMAEEELPPPLE